MILVLLSEAVPVALTHLVGIDEVDHFGTQWFYWLVHLEMFNPAGGGLAGLSHTDMVFYPYGKDIYGHTGANILDAIIAAPLREWLGPILSYNVFILLGMTFNVWAFSRLAREFTEDRITIWMSSLWFGCSPFIVFEVVEGRPTQAIVGLLCLFLKYMWRAGRSPGLWAPILAGLMLGIVGYQYWFYAFFGGVAALAHGLYRAATPTDEVSSIRVLLQHAMIASVALLVAWPGAGGLFTGAASGDVPGLLNTAEWTMSEMDPRTTDGTVVGLLTWQPMVRWSMFYVIREGQTLMMAHQRTTSWVLLGLVCIYLWRPGKLRRGPVIAIALVMALIAIGPKLAVGSWWLPNPFYIYLVKKVGFLQRLWWPGRAYVILCILGGLACTMALLWARRRGPKVAAGMILGVSALMMIDLSRSWLLPLPAWDASVPAGYKCLASGPPGAIIEVPFGWNQRHLYYQSAHNRPIYGGMIENNPIFSPPEVVELRKSNSYLAQVLYKTGWTKPMQTWTLAEKQKLRHLPYQPGTINKDMDYLPDDKQALQDLGYRYIVLMKDAMVLPNDASENALRVQKTRERKYRSALSKLAGREVYNDRRISIFAPWGGGSPCKGVDITRDKDRGPEPHQNPTSSVVPFGQSIGTLNLTPLFE